MAFRGGLAGGPQCLISGRQFDDGMEAVQTNGRVFLLGVISRASIKDLECFEGIPENPKNLSVSPGGHPRPAAERVTGPML
ncbi:MAG TPA: hypothetical protein VME43_22200 [Bryobacteraceae bacterium]|nr:hypothetical protein [Bryobacteraceae bacterium]